MIATKTLGTELPKEIARCQELLVQYAEIGPAGQFVYMMIKMDIDKAVQSLASGDVVAMLDAYVALKGCE